MNPAREAARNPRIRPLVAALFVTALAAGLWTAADYGIASDVSVYFSSSLRELGWIRRLVEAIAAGHPLRALNTEVVFEHWRWFQPRIPHPPLSRELSGLSYLLFHRIAAPLVAYRVATIVAFAALVASCGWLTAKLTGSRLAGTAAGGAVLTFPALFAYGHLADTDMFLTAFWFGSVCALEAHLRDGKASALWASGLLLGAAIATKFTGLLLIPVLAVWLLRRRSDLKRSAVVLALASMAVFVITNPVLWVDPVQGLADYLGAGFGRAHAEVARITTLYFGTIYTYRPPWHYPLVWTAIVVPLPLWAVIAVGVSAWRVSPLVELSGLNLAVMYGALLLPSAPLHDGVRLLMPALPFLCVLAGVGVWRLRSLLTPLAARCHLSRDLLGGLVLVGFLALPAVRTLEVHPYQLSYFNALIGGVQGAARHGLEVTGLKEVLGPDALTDLSAAIPADAVVEGGFFTEELCFDQAFGLIPAGWSVESRMIVPGARQTRTLTCAGGGSNEVRVLSRPARPPDFLFVLNRPGQYTMLENALTRFGGQPFYELNLEGVPLVRVYRNARGSEAK